MYRRLAIILVFLALAWWIGAPGLAAEPIAGQSEIPVLGASTGLSEESAEALESPAASEESPEPAGESSKAVDEPAEPEREVAADAEPATAEPPQREGNLIRMTEDYDLWVDTRRRLVVVDGEICLREGMLEMFACPRGTKEHESIVSVNCPPRFVHAALLAVGAEPGRPVQFAPEYVTAEGPVIHVWVLWIDEDGQRRRNRAQDWIKNVKTEQQMSHDWVFAGSGFWFDEHTNQRQYYADGGDFICVANFPTAMMDLPVKSPQDNIDLLFTAYTERIPPLGTRVRLVLIPQLD